MAFKFFAFAALVAIARASVVPHQVTYAQVPVVKTVVDSEYDPNPQYSFSYDVQDPFTGDSKSQVESRSGDVVHGQYSLNDPDGTRRTVDYTADPINGFNAVVKKSPLVHTYATPVIKSVPVVHTNNLEVASPVVAKVPSPVVANVDSVVSHVASPVVAKVDTVAYTAPVSHVSSPVVTKVSSPVVTGVDSVVSHVASPYVATNVDYAPVSHVAYTAPVSHVGYTVPVSHKVVETPVAYTGGYAYPYTYGAYSPYVKAHYY